MAHIESCKLTVANRHRKNKSVTPWEWIAEKPLLRGRDVGILPSNDEGGVSLSNESKETIHWGVQDRRPKNIHKAWGAVLQQLVFGRIGRHKHVVLLIDLAVQLPLEVLAVNRALGTQGLCRLSRLHPENNLHIS